MSAPGVPFVFGPNGHRLFGVWHPAQVATFGTRRSAVVLACPVGWEAIASHRAIRNLADRLANRGFHVLRFDYPGTGDSPGDELEPGRIAAWTDGVRFAIDEAKRLGNVESVCVFGVQLGATLACLAAEGRADVEGLVVWAPVLTGRALLRQVRAYRMLNAPADPGSLPEPVDGEEAAGFVLTQETIRDLERVDLLSLRRPLARRALVLAKDEHSPEAKLVAVLMQGGTPTELRRIAGYLPMMQEPRLSVVPAAVFECVEQWLVDGVPGDAARAPRRMPLPGARLDLPFARESAFHLGASSGLFGILTEPAHPPSRPRPVILWLNTSYDHRVGPNRLYVTLARELASLGFSSVRFDPRGIGDSAPVVAQEDVHPYSEMRLSDAREVMDFLAAEHGAKQFALVGLCSASYVAFHIARNDPRVVSEVLINPQNFDWKDGDSLELAARRSFQSNRFYQKKLVDLETWRRALNGEVNARGVMKVVGQRLARRARRQLERWLPLPRREDGLDIEQAFRAKLKRGTKVLLVLGEDDGGVDYIESHLGAFGSALRGVPGFSMDVLPVVDHTFSHRWMKAQLSARIVRHLAGEHARDTQRYSWRSKFVKSLPNTVASRSTPPPWQKAEISIKPG